MLEGLSDELLVRIFAACDPDCLRSLSTSCSRYHQLCTDDLLWHSVFAKVMGADPMCRLCPWSWRDELLRRRLLLGKWSGRDRKMHSFTLPGCIGRVVHMGRLGRDVAVVVGESGLLRLSLGDSSKDKACKRLVFYYSTMFSESAVLTAATFDERHLVFGFSDGSLVILDGVPKRDWSDCNWHTRCSGGTGPPIVGLELKGKFLLSVGHRQQSETAAFVQVFNLRTKSRTLSQVVPGYSFCALGEDGSVFVPQVPGIERQVGRVLVGRSALVVGEQSIPVEYSACFSNDRNLVLVSEEGQLLLFSPSQQSFSARLRLQTRQVLDVFVLDEVLIAAAEEGTLFIVDAVGGRCIAKQTFKRKPGPVKVLAADSGTVWFVNGNEFTVLSIKAPAMLLPAAKANKPGPRTKKDLRASITEALQERSSEKRAEEHLDRIRSTANIDGLSEAELIQYAQLLSLDEMHAGEMK